MKIVFLVLAFIFFAGIAGAACAFIAIFYFSIKMAFQYKEKGEAFSGKTLWNPFNAIFFPSLLNEKGLYLRKKLLISALAFVVCTVSSGSVAILMQALYGHNY